MMIVVSAIDVVPWDLGILPQWLMISTLSMALVRAVYELLLRRVNAPRWLSGVKPRHHPLGEQAKQVQPEMGSIAM